MNLKLIPLPIKQCKKQTSGDLTSAIDIYKQAALLAPQNARLWTNLGTAYQQSDQFKEAQAAYQKGYDLDNKNEVGDLYLLGVIQENYKQGALALASYKNICLKLPQVPMLPLQKTV